MTIKEKRKCALRAVKENFIWSRVLLLILGVVAFPFLGYMSVDAMSLYVYSQNVNMILLSLWGTFNVGLVIVFLGCVCILVAGISEVINVYRFAYKKM